MMERTLFGLTAILVLLILPDIAVAQHAPYAGMQTRSVKALSDQQLADLKAGRGMGLALAAELNGFPGPVHVLELGKELSLSVRQRERIEALFAAMKREAVPLGERLIALESELDRQFASKSITQASLKSSVTTIGAVQSDLRAAHLKYHLLTLDVLTPQQVARYSELRGYAPSTQPNHTTHPH
jgi:Spy/CpxP family protein refolding chaperone